MGMLRPQRIRSRSYDVTAWPQDSRRYCQCQDVDEAKCRTEYVDCVSFLCKSSKFVGTCRIFFLAIRRRGVLVFAAFESSQ